MMRRCLFALGLGLLAACDAPAPWDRKPAAVAVAVENYAPAPLLDRSLPELADALRAGEVSSEGLVRAYLARIERIDRSGPALRSVLSVNPDALADARARDAERTAALDRGVALPPLHGLPLLIKDNIETRDALPTTAGALALVPNVTGRDAPAVAGLRAAGAVILGKSNLSQWANFRSRNSMSGWSAVGGQVKNPHVLDRNPCGSSAGSGAAVAASLAAAAVGTETNGSIICPSTVNGIVGFKPTVGLVSQRFIVPVSSSQDTAGPMTKTVRGTAMMLDAMAEPGRAAAFVAALDDGALRGKRVGALRFTQGGDARVVALYDAALAAMERAGAVVVDVTEAPAIPAEFAAQGFAVLKYEFRATLNQYLADSPAPLPARSLDALMSFNDAHASVELALFGQDIFEAAEAMAGRHDEYLEAVASVQKATQAGGIDALMAEHELDVLTFPSGPLAPPRDAVNGDVWPASVGVTWMAAVAGYPHATVPMGAVRALPVGVSFVGARNADAAIMAMAYAYEQASKARVAPTFLESAAEVPRVASALAGAGEDSG